MKVELRSDGRQWAFIGEEWLASPPVPKHKSEFINGHIKNRKDQKWKRDYPEEGEIESMTTADRDKLQDRELDRRELGCWFFNDGEPTYLTGDHYNFLAHSKLPDGNYADFRDADQEYFWWWKFAVEDDENCIGGTFMGARQRGKTARVGSQMVNYASLNPNVWCGIQSKNDRDAGDVFKLFCVGIWQNMSYILRPKNPAGDDPKTELYFGAAPRKGKKAEGKREWALSSRIDYRPSKENSYDSKTLKRYFMDEAFKKQEYDSEERRKVISRMMWRGGKAIAKMILASTVDEKEGFDPAVAQKIWEEANPNAKTATGRTKNGLKRLFMPATKAHIMDGYGRSLVEESLADIEANAPDASDQVASRSYYRANPRSEDDAFASGTTDSILNVDVLNAVQRKIKSELDEQVVRQVDLVWADAERTRIKTSDNKVNGRFRLVMRAVPDIQNHVQPAGEFISPTGEVLTRYKPLNNAFYAAGCDPYDAREVADLGAASKGAAYVLRKPDVLHEDTRLVGGVERPDYWPSDAFVVEYVNRPPRPADFYEDMVKLCHFFGCAMLPERQKPGIIHYFENRGYKDFIGGQVALTDTARKKLNKKKGGVSENYGHAASGDATNQWSELMAEFSHGPLKEDWRRMPFEWQVKDWLAMNVKDTKKYDAAVASGWTLMQARRYTRTRTTNEPMSITALFASTYRN